MEKWDIKGFDAISEGEILQNITRNQLKHQQQPNKRKISLPILNKSVNTSTVAAGYISNEGDNIKVYVRIRPPVKQENNSTASSICLEVNSRNSLTIFTKPEAKQFSYDHVAGMETAQEEVFATVGKGIIEAFVDGFNGTIFAYGQTGSGKTFTMMGPPGEGGVDTFAHELRGVIPRGFEYMFSLINREREKAGDRVEFIASCSFLEIYNEQVYDLLNPSTAGLQLRENIKKGVFVDGLAERDVTSAKDAYSALEAGWLNRRVAATSMNRESSRSHAVFTVSLSSKKRTGGIANIKVSKLHLVDLAGSERQKDTHTQDLRLKEAGSINKSLSALGNVIMALVDIAHGKTRHVHYRDSKLTFILRIFFCLRIYCMSRARMAQQKEIFKDSLGGNAKTYIIANVHPSSSCFGETLSTLNFARRAKMIKNRAFINEDVSGNVSELQAEIRKLKELLALTQSSLPKTPSANAASSNDGSKTADEANQWREMMLNAIATGEQSEKEKETLQEKVLNLEELCRKKEVFVQSQKMIIKFRSETITKLKRNDLHSNSNEEKDKEIKALKEEMKLLHSTIENHPEVKRYAIENNELRAEIKRLKSIDPSNGDFMKSMAEKHRYTLQLERQLHQLMTVQSNDLEKSLSSSQQSLEATNLEMEKLKINLAQLQSKLDIAQNELEQSRRSLQEKCEESVCAAETFRKQELELKSELVAVRKSNNDFERALETLQLKTAVERSAMNSLHIQTIKTLASPNKFGTPCRSPSKNATNGLRGKHSTPVSASLKRNKTPLKPSNLLNNSHVHQPNDETSGAVEERDSFDEISDEEFDPFWNFADETQDDEVEYLEALQKEMKHLQNLYNCSCQALHEEQKKQIDLKETMEKFKHQVKELDQLLEKERTDFADKEIACSSQLTSIREKYKEAHTNCTILTSQVDDLKSRLSSSEKQVTSLKKEKDGETIEAGKKCAGFESKFVKLEVDFLNLKNEMDGVAESNNNLQVEYEQCKDELEFSRHKCCELEEEVLKYQERLKEEEGKLQTALEKLNTEVETKIKLTQEDKQQELMQSVETIVTLRAELSSLTKTHDEKENLITKLKSDLEKSRSEVAAQKWLNLSDKEAINNFMKTVEELRVEMDNRESIIMSANLELEDTKQQLNCLQEFYSEKKQKICKLADSLKCESDKLANEKLLREKEVLQLKEEMTGIQEDFKELSKIMGEKDEQLQQMQIESDLLKTSVSEKTAKICALEKRQEGCVDDANLTIDVSRTERQSKESLEELSRLSLNYESSHEESNWVIEDLRRRCSELESVQSGQEVLEGRIRVLESELEDLEEQKKLTEQKMRLFELEVASLKEKIEKEKANIREVNGLKDDLELKNNVLQHEFDEYKVKLFMLQEDLDVNVEELEKTKVLEDKYFSEKTKLQSKLEVIEEERGRYLQEIQKISKQNDNLQAENTKLSGHHNHQQRIKVLMDLKKERNELKEDNDKMRQELLYFKSRIEGK